MPIDTQDFRRFMNRARDDLPGSSDAGIKAMLYEILDEFCDDSTAWIEALSINVIASTPSAPNTTYNLVPQDDGKIIRLISVFDSNSVPQPAFLPQSDIESNGVGQLVFVNPYTLNQTMMAYVAKSVCATSEDQIPIISGTLFNRFYRYIVDGVVGKMMLTQGRPYSNPQLGAMRYQKFRDGVAMARVQTMRQFTQGASSWNFPRAWRTQGQRGGVSTAFPNNFF